MVSKKGTGAILALLFCVALCGCEKSDDEKLRDAAVVIAKRAAAASPAFKGARLTGTWTIDGGGGDDLCMCLKVCDANGQNCTPCTCDPAGCGNCD
jgi:hypothetical protein